MAQKKAVKQKTPDKENTPVKKKSSSVEKIKELENLISNTKYNKKTQHAIGLYKAQLAKLKDKEETRSSRKTKGDGYSVRKSGDATVILVGFPSAGKSSLLNKITNANSPVGAYEFTTLDVIPGLLEHKDAKIQILDVPGIVRGAATGRGRGREVLSVLQNADLALIIVDVLRTTAYDVIKKEIFDSHLRLNKRKPDVKITKKIKDGIRIGKTIPLPDLKNDTIKAILKEFKISNADVLIRSKIDADDFIDVVERNKVYIPGLTVLNKIDLVSKKRLEEIKKELKPDICISAEEELNLDILKELIFDKLDFMRIYCKEVGKKADLGIPLIMKRKSKVRDMCNKLHRDFVTKFKFARVWGKSAKFPGQRLMLPHTLQDKDIVEIHLN